MSPEMQVLLSAADRAIGRLDAATELPPNPDLFVAMCVRKEAVLSSQLEGTQASLVDLLEFEAKAVSKDRLPDIQEVVNYVRAMNYGLERLAESPVSLRLLKEIHAELLKALGVQNTNRESSGGHRTGLGHTGAMFLRPSFCLLPHPRH